MGVDRPNSFSFSTDSCRTVTGLNLLRKPQTNEALKYIKISPIKC